MCILLMICIICGAFLLGGLLFSRSVSTILQLVVEDEDDYESDKEEIKAELKTETIFKCDSDDDDDRVRLVLCSEHIKAGKIFLSFINI